MISSLFFMMGGLLFKNLLGIISVLMLSMIFLWLNLVILNGSWEMSVGILKDSLSIMMIILSIWICTMIFMAKGIWKNLYKILMMMIMFMLIMCFLMENMFSFYIFFELVLIPMFLLIIMYGNYTERLESSLYLLFYTMTGSLPLFFMIMSGLKNFSWNFMYSNIMKMEFNVEGLLSMMMIMAFLSKLPMYGVHIWLPKAHVEAPSVGSSILAGVLLKLGGYGILRVLSIMEMGIYFKWLFVMIGLIGGINCGLICFRQNDMKKLVAYSSVIHMGFSLSGAMIYLEEGWMGVLMMMMCHGFCSSGLFFFVNMIYERTLTRSFMLIKGCGILCPSMMAWCFLLVISNMGCPPFLGLFSESLLSISLLKLEFLLSIFVGMMLFITVGYNIYFYSVINHGSMSLIVFKPVVIQEYFLLFLHFCPGIFLIFGMDMFMYS